MRMQPRLFDFTPVQLPSAEMAGRVYKPAALVFVPSRSLGISLLLCVCVKIDCRQDEAASEMTLLGVRNAEGERKGMGYRGAERGGRGEGSPVS
eukprot:766454-Hanusia_phi.AAC.16